MSSTRMTRFTYTETRAGGEETTRTRIAWCIPEICLDQAKRYEPDPMVIYMTMAAAEGDAPSEAWGDPWIWTREQPAVDRPQDRA